MVLMKARDFSDKSSERLKRVSKDSLNLCALTLTTIKRNEIFSTQIYLKKSTKSTLIG